MSKLKPSCLLFLQPSARIRRFCKDIPWLPDRSGSPRGLDDLRTAEAIIPLALLDQFYEAPWDFLEKVRDTQIRFRYRDFPSFLYPPGTEYDSENPREGLLQGPVLVVAYRFLITGAGSAYNKDNQVGKPSQAMIHGITEVEPEGIAFAAVGTRMSIMGTGWVVKCPKTGFNYEKFYDYIIGIFRRQSQHPWVIKTMHWWNKQVSLVRSLKNARHRQENDSDSDSEDPVDQLFSDAVRVSSSPPPDNDCERHQCPGHRRVVADNHNLLDLSDHDDHSSIDLPQPNEPFFDFDYVNDDMERQQTHDFQDYPEADGMELACNPVAMNDPSNSANDNERGQPQEKVNGRHNYHPRAESQTPQPQHSSRTLPSTIRTYGRTTQQTPSSAGPTVSSAPWSHIIQPGLSASSVRRTSPVISTMQPPRHRQRTSPAISTTQPPRHCQQSSPVTSTVQQPPSSQRVVQSIEPIRQPPPNHHAPIRQPPSSHHAPVRQIPTIQQPVFNPVQPVRQTLTTHQSSPTPPSEKPQHSSLKIVLPGNSRVPLPPAANQTSQKQKHKHIKERELTPGSDSENNSCTPLISMTNQPPHRQKRKHAQEQEPTLRSDDGSALTDLPSPQNSSDEESEPLPLKKRVKAESKVKAKGKSVKAKSSNKPKAAPQKQVRPPTIPTRASSRRLVQNC